MENAKKEENSAENNGINRMFHMKHFVARWLFCEIHAEKDKVAAEAVKIDRRREKCSATALIRR